MLAAGDRFEELDLNLALYLVLAKIGRTNLNLIPLKGASIWSLDLRLVHGSVLAWGDVSVNYEETEAAFWQGRQWTEDDDFGIGCRRLLLSIDRDGTIFTGTTFLVDKRLGHNLVSCSDDLVHLKLERADKIMRTQVFSLVIIRVVDLNLEHLLLLEMEVDHDFSNKLGA